jgi:hypothetical protein
LYGLLFQIGGKDGSQPSVFLKQAELDEALCLAQIQDQLRKHGTCCLPPDESWSFN